MISKNLKKRIYTSIGLLFLITTMFYVNSILVFSLLVLSVVSLLEFFNMIKKIGKNNLYSFTLSFIFLIYIFSFSFLFFLFSNFLQLKIILFVLLTGCIASDIGGYIIGKKFGGPKLTRISPKKTISGSIGSLVFCSITIPTIFYFFTNHISFYLIVASLLTSVFCQIGDLLFSFLKRKANLKDTGNFLPGHGGVLDRIDGILLGIPAGFFAITLFY